MEDLHSDTKPPRGRGLNLGRFVIGVGLVFGVITVVFLLKYVFESKEPEKLMNAGCEVECLIEIAVEIAENEGAEKAMIYVAELAKNPKNSMICHGIAHAVGHKIGEVGYSNYINTTCQNGYLHGMIQARAEKNPGEGFSVETMKYCDQFEKSKTENPMWNECLHGLGHGVAVSWPNDIESALRTCSGFKDEVADVCASGVMMENGQDTGEVEGEFGIAGERLTRVSKDVDLGKLCRNSARNVKEECYRLLWQLAYERHLNDIKEAEKVCQYEEDAYFKELCNKGFGNYAIELVRANKPTWPPISESGAFEYAEQILVECRRLDFKELCIEEAARATYSEMMVIEEPKNLWPPLCENALKTERTSCERGIKAAEDLVVLIKTTETQLGEVGQK